jgi:hypothetical protein
MELVLSSHSVWPEYTTLDTGSGPFFTVLNSRTYLCSKVRAVIVVGKSAQRWPRPIRCNMVGCVLKSNAKCSICCSDSGGIEQLYHLCCNAMYSARSQPTLRRNFSFHR